MIKITPRIGVTFPQAKRSCGINGPTNIKRTPRCFKKKFKKAHYTHRLQAMHGWTDCILAPPALGDIKCQHTTN